MDANRITFNTIKNISEYASAFLIENGDTVTCIKNRYGNRTIAGCKRLKFERIKESELEECTVEMSRAKYYGKSICIVLNK